MSFHFTIHSLDTGAMPTCVYRQICKHTEFERYSFHASIMLYIYNISLRAFFVSLFRENISHSALCFCFEL